MKNYSLSSGSRGGYRRMELRELVREDANQTPPTREEERMLAAQVAAGDSQAIAALCRGRLAYALKVTNWYARNSPQEIREEAFLSACEGLVEAATNYDGSTAFLSYATAHMRQKVVSQLKQITRPARMNNNLIVRIDQLHRYLQQETRGKEEEHEALLQKLSHSVETNGPITVHVPRHRLSFAHTSKTIALYVTPDLIESYRADRGMARSISLDQPPSLPDYSPRNIVPADSHTPLDSTLGSERAALLEEGLKSINERDALVLRLHYGLDDGQERTLEAIAVKLGITRERVRQLRNRAIEKLRENSSMQLLNEHKD